MPLSRPQGMRAFTLIWAGQVLSLIGSSMTGFALTIWAWKMTGQATALAGVAIASFLPQVLFAPLTGALVDRWNRKLTMMLSDLATGLTTLIILALYWSGHLEIWHLYVTGAFAGFFQSFQWPAYSAAISLMIPKEQYTRATGMLSLAEWGAGVLAPILASALIGVLDISGIMMIDLTTLSLAIVTLLRVAIPRQTRNLQAEGEKSSLWQDMLYGFRFIAQRPSLLGLQLVFFGGNLLSSMAGTLNSPVILAATDNNSLLLGSTQSVAAVGGILGSVLVTAWGGPRRRVDGVFRGWILYGLLGAGLYGLGVHWMVLWYVGAFLGAFVVPMINSSNQAIWQSKVQPSVQGRVFSVRRMIAQVTAPLGMWLGARFADRWMEPLMQQPENHWAAFLGGLFGNRPGSGMAVIIFVAGLLAMLVGLLAYLVPPVRDVESTLPDHTAEISPPGA